MFDVGRLAVKIAGRDSGKYCVVVEKLDTTFVLIDGQTRRKKCNVKHLEPLEKTIDIKKGASHNEIVKEFGKLKIPLVETKARQKKTPKPVKKRIALAKQPVEKKPAKEQKKEEKKKPVVKEEKKQKKTK